MKSKKIVLVIGFFVLLVSSISLFAKENEENKFIDNVLFNAGIKSAYSDGITEGYFYYFPFIKGGYGNDFFSVTAGYIRYLNYQISDGVSIYNYINVNNVNGSVDFKGIKNSVVSGNVSYSSGDSEYSHFDYQFGLEHEFSKVTILGEFGKGNSEYNINFIDIETDNYDIYVEVSYFDTKEKSFDLSYTFLNVSSTGGDELNYSKNVIRGGMFSVYKNNIYLSLGISIGRDSESYLSLGGDGGVKVILFDHLKIGFMALYSYNTVAGGIRGTTEESYSILRINSEISYKW